jgi:hypothetical protein
MTNEERKLLNHLIHYRGCMRNHENFKKVIDIMPADFRTWLEQHGRELLAIQLSALTQIERADFLSPERREELKGRFLLPV